MRFAALILIFILLSCEQEVDLDIDFGEKKTVLNCILNPNETFQVSLTKSTNINDTNKFEHIVNASVLVFENNYFLDSLKINHLGVYTSSLMPKTGKSYTLKAFLPDSTIITATDSIPFYTQVDSFNCVGNIKGRLNFDLYMNDILLDKNFYKIELFEVLENNIEKKTGFHFNDENLRVFSLLDTSMLFRDLEFKNSAIKLSIICDAPKATRMHIKISQLSESLFKYITFANQNYLANSGTEYARVPNFSNVSNNIGILGSITRVDFYTKVK